MNKILITGIDGYLGWSLALYLIKRGHEIGGIDLFFRRKWVKEMGSLSAIPIATMAERIKIVDEVFNEKIKFWKSDLRDYHRVKQIVRKFKPDVIVHFGECPSAPFSMIDNAHAQFVQTNNISTTFNIIFAIKEINPKIHLIKLGTMGEYGTPNVAIPEGFFRIKYRRRSDIFPFPRQAGSWYHWSKVFGSNNIMLACKLWKLCCTDIMQGIVYGASIEEMKQNKLLQTRLDFDEAFGTIINRFCCQAVIGHPLTLYGKGHQKRGFISLKDCMQCIYITIKNPPSDGEYRVFNQFESLYDLSNIALKVKLTGSEIGIKSNIINISNPRKEKEGHYYYADRNNLAKLGYKPSKDMITEIKQIMRILILHKKRIMSRKKILLPKIQW